MTSKDKTPLSIKNKSWKKSISNFFSRIPHDRDTLIEILRAAEKRNIIDPDALIMIEGALQVSKMQVRDIMVPRVQMIVIKSDADPLDIHATVVESGHSRFPVIGGDTDQVLGILLAKDLLGYFSSEEENNCANIYRGLLPFLAVTVFTWFTDSGTLFSTFL